MPDRPQPDMFAADAEPDLFGDGGAAKVYVPKPEHVRNRLSDLVAQMRAADIWPWPEATVRLHREKTFDYLTALLADEAEAEDWRQKIDIEVSRLISASEKAA